MKQIEEKEGILRSTEEDIVRHSPLINLSVVKQNIDDLAEEHGTLHAYVGKSDFAKGIILDIDLKEVWASEV